MDAKEWDRLMRRARRLAVIQQERTQVHAARLSPRSARTWGTEWIYVMDCPSYCACRDL